MESDSEYKRRIALINAIEDYAYVEYELMENINKIAIFGTGKIYDKYKNLVFSRAKVIALLDNDESKQGRVFDGIMAVAPVNCIRMDIDYIVVMTVSYAIVAEQLLLYGIPYQKIIYYEQFLAMFDSDCVEYRYRIDALKDKRLLLIANNLNYDGGSIAIVNAAEALSESWDVTLVSARIDDKYMLSISENNISIAIYTKLLSMSESFIEWAKSFDAVLVNTFQMFNVCLQLDGQCPLFWWIHEPNEVYDTTFFTPFKDRVLKLSSCVLMPVGNIAWLNYISRFRHKKEYILPYCILDKGNGAIKSNKDKPLTFAVIGGISERKSQKTFVEAVRQLPYEIRTLARFLIIGSGDSTEYGKELLNSCSDLPEVMVTGIYTRREIDQAFRKEIDVVVCTSIEDPLPIVLTEGMMYGKPCIMSDSCGNKEYVENGVNGFVYHTGETKALSKLIERFINNEYNFNDIARKSRKIYEEFFLPEVFVNNLENIMRQESKKMGWSKLEKILQRESC